MAKTDDAGFLEMHVEKILLAAAVILVPVLLYFMVVRGPASEIRIDGMRVSPDQVDKRLKEKAEEVQALIEAADAGVEPIGDWASYLAARYENPTPSKTLTPVVSGPPKLEPVEAPKEIRVALATLVEALPAPGKPLASAQLEVLMKPKANAAAAAAAGAAPGQFVPVNFDYDEVVGVHVAAVFEHGKAMAEWAKSLAKVRVQAALAVMAVEAQRQHRLDDGSWSAPEPVSIVRVPAEAPFPPTPPYDGKNLAEVLNALAYYHHAEVMQWICEPEYWSLFKDGQGVHWIENKPRTPVSDLAGVVEERMTPGRMYLPPTERYPVPFERSPTPPARTPSRTFRPGPPVGPMEGMESIPLPPGERTTRRPIPRPGAGMDRMDEFGPVPPSRRYGPATPTRTPTPAVTPRPMPAMGEPEPVQPRLDPRVPALTDQLADPAGICEVWFHDTSAVLGRMYRYRLRLVLVSPLLGRPGIVQDKADADKISVITPWSAWSDPVGVQKSPDFFLTGSMLDQVAVTVFVDKWGQKVSERFNVRKGERIRKKVERTLTYFTGEERKEEIDFDTGAWAVDLAFKVPVPRSGGIFSNDTELIYTDDKGRLLRRSMLDDQESEEFKQLEQRVQQ